MLDRSIIREETDRVRAALEHRGLADAVDLDALLELDAAWRERKARGDELRHERNEVSEQIGEYKRSGEEAKAEEAIERSQDLKDELEAVGIRADDPWSQISRRQLLETPATPQRDRYRSARTRADNVEATPRGLRRPARPSAGGRSPLRPRRGPRHHRRGPRREDHRQRLLLPEGRRRPPRARAHPVHARRPPRAGLRRRASADPVSVPARCAGTGQLPKFADDAYRRRRQQRRGLR
ncbi:MAG: hypothetical protein U5K37_12220 [Natrialbaceae archaeon]|nr:hypothetical protein [Natrialbaceae archaeon]